MSQMPSQTVSFYDPRSEAEAKRKRALADKLMQIGDEKPENEMSGKYVVAQSPWEGIARAAQGSYGAYLGQQADNEASDLSVKRQKAIAEALASKDVNTTIGTLAQHPETMDAAVQLYAKNLKNTGGFGVESNGFEGDIARAMYVLGDDTADESSKRRAQAVVDTAQRLTGSWNPVTGTYDYNNKNRFGSGGYSAQSPMGQAFQGGSVPQSQNMGMPPQPTMQAPQGGLLPPPDMSSATQPDAAMFSPAFQATGNPKVDAALQQKAAEEQMRLQTERVLAQQKAQQEGQSGLSQSVDKARNAMSVIDLALNSPGLSSSVGGPFGMQGRQASILPLTEAQRNFQPLVNQIKGTAFLEAFNSLKGGGQITEVEGEKATQAIARLDQAQSEESFRQALNELRGIIQTGLERAQRQATGDFSAPAPTAAKRLKFNPQTGKLE